MINLSLFHRFINGQSYMEAVAKAILVAKEEIFITDWWLSPELLLVRPADDSMRLDNLLGKKAVNQHRDDLIYSRISSMKSIIDEI